MWHPELHTVILCIGLINGKQRTTSHPPCYRQCSFIVRPKTEFAFLAVSVIDPVHSPRVPTKTWALYVGTVDFTTSCSLPSTWLKWNRTVGPGQEIHERRGAAHSSFCIYFNLKKKRNILLCQAAKLRQLMQKFLEGRQCKKQKSRFDWCHLGNILMQTRVIWKILSEFLNHQNKILPWHKT